MHCTHLVLVNVHAFLVNVMAKECHFALKEFTVFEFSKELEVSQQLQCLREVFFVFLQGARVDENIIQVHNHTFVQ